MEQETIYLQIDISSRLLLRKFSYIVISFWFINYNT